MAVDITTGLRVPAETEKPSSTRVADTANSGTRLGAGAVRATGTTPRASWVQVVTTPPVGAVMADDPDAGTRLL